MTSKHVSDCGCDLCGDFPAQLRAGCHPTAPLRMELATPTLLIVRCYVPTCNREVAKFALLSAEQERTTLNDPLLMEAD